MAIENSTISDPLVTIVTVCFNSEPTLSDTMNSVLNQTYPNIEYLIIDGGSKDQTLNIIRSFEDKFRERKILFDWISEPDSGIYNAMNKGIHRSNGEIIGIINSDDWYDPNAIASAVNHFTLYPKAMLLHGNLVFHETKKPPRTIKPKSQKSALIWQGMTLLHPTFFVKSEVYEILKFDERYQLVADYKFLMEAFKAKYPITYLDKILSHMRAGGASEAFYQRIVEGHRIRRELGFGLIVTWLSTFYRVGITLASRIKRCIRN